MLTKESEKRQNDWKFQVTLRIGQIAGKKKNRIYANDIHESRSIQIEKFTFFPDENKKNKGGGNLKLRGNPKIKTTFE